MDKYYTEIYMSMKKVVVAMVFKQMDSFLLAWRMVVEVAVKMK